jgi:hypothetical protein
MKSMHFNFKDLIPYARKDSFSNTNIDINFLLLKTLLDISLSLSLSLSYTRTHMYTHMDTHKFCFDFIPYMC